MAAIFFLLTQLQNDDKSTVAGRTGRRLMTAADNETSQFPKDIFTDDQLAKGAILLHVLGLLYMFYALALVCDHFFVPALHVIIERFGIPPDVAGATLMAAGGSAPELFTSIIGVFIAVSDVGTGTIVGSAVFNLLFVIAACAMVSATALTLTVWPLLRDAAFYSLSLLLLTVFYADNMICWYESLSLLLCYAAYVGFMKFNEAAEKKFLSIFGGHKKADFETPGRQIGVIKLLEQMHVKVDEPYAPEKMMAGIPNLKKLLRDDNENEETSHKNPAIFEAEQMTEKVEEEEEVDYEIVLRAGPPGGILANLAWFITIPLMLPMWVTMPDPNNPDRIGNG